jgi:glycosyltransferase involved in cell wall biosynthesis
MRIVQVGTHLSGGAAKAMIRLNDGLLNLNLNSQIISKSTISKVEIKKDLRNKLINKIKHAIFKNISVLEEWELEVFNNQIINSRPEGLEMTSLPLSSYDITQSKYYRMCDVVHLHWVADFLDWPTFFAKNRKPVVWTLHDMNPFSGIEHYRDPYQGIDSNGKPIPRKKNEGELLLSEKWLNFKKEILKKRKCDITIVSPSKWINNESINSDLFGDLKHHYISNGIDNNIFYNRSKLDARSNLNIPGDSIVLLFVADNINNKRKGLDCLLKAVENLQIANDVLIYCIGYLSEFESMQNVYTLDRIEDEDMMAKAYSAADAFIIPSLEDNLPNTMIESLMCGTSVIGFPVGGIAETIEDGVNGYLCDEISVNALEKTIKKYIENINLFNREQIASDARKKFSADIQARAYVYLYEQILQA